MSTSPFYPAVQEHTRAQRLQPQNAEIAVRLLDACLGADMLVCAAHQVRSLLRHPDAHLKSSQAWRCDGLASARVFGERAEAVRWCPHGQACRAVTNATADAAVAAGPMAALDGGLWRGENFVSVLKELLASEREWKGGSAQQQHNHATMQQMQGNGEIARKLYAKVLAPWSSPELAPSVDVLAHAYGNLAQLERGAAARRQLEAALSLLPAGESAAVWWREVAAVHAVGAKTSLARHAARKAIKLRPDSAFAHALSGELDLTRHEWGKAHDGFARADALQAASAPEMPPCARWSSIGATVLGSNSLVRKKTTLASGTRSSVCEISSLSSTTAPMSIFSTALCVVTVRRLEPEPSSCQQWHSMRMVTPAAFAFCRCSR